MERFNCQIAMVQQRVQASDCACHCCLKDTLMRAEGIVKDTGDRSEHTWFRRHSIDNSDVKPCAKRAAMKPACCIAKTTLAVPEPILGIPCPFSLTSPLQGALKACHSPLLFPITRENHASSMDSTDSGSTSASRSDAEVDDETEHVHDNYELPGETPDVLEERQNAPCTLHKSNSNMAISSNTGVSLHKVCAP